MEPERLKRIAAAKAKARNLPPLSDEEDAELTAAALADPDNPICDDEWFARAKPMCDERLAEYRNMRRVKRSPAK